ncbi:MAG: hypothetical protein JSV12_08135 [Candidatus Bathyarchaeota archaeon]|nr:MAG: hypothetical protein JSV12_08135 [Candidatus Bathyarchaeota archaeon]
MRKIPEKVQKVVLELWFEGNNYRDISSRTDVSIGAISSILDIVRRKTPDLDELKKSNLKIRKQGSSIQDALRGSQLLEKVNQLRISLDRLESLLKIMSEIASERHTGEEKIVNASLKLMNLEAQFKKTYKKIIQDFQAKQTQINHLEQRTEKLLEEGQKLNKEKRDLGRELSR